MNQSVCESEVGVCEGRGVEDLSGSTLYAVQLLGTHAERIAASTAKRASAAGREFREEKCKAPERAGMFVSMRQS